MRAGAQTGPPERRGGFTPPKPQQLAQHFPQLEILDLIGHGGMGAVYKASQRGLDRLVALKILLLDAHSDETLRRRFLREAEVLAMLAHPNIVPIYDIVWEDGMPLFYSMKMVKGRTLEAILDNLRKEDPETLRCYPGDSRPERQGRRRRIFPAARYRGRHAGDHHA